MTVLNSRSMQSHFSAHPEVIRDSDEQFLGFVIKRRGFLFRALVILPRFFGVGWLISLLPSRVTAFVVRSPVPIRVKGEMDDHNGDFIKDTRTSVRGSKLGDR